MNISATKDEFHHLMMLYIINMAKGQKAMLTERQKQGDTLTDFELFLLHVTAKPLGDLRLSYFKSDPNMKLMFNRLSNEFSKKDEIRVLL